MMKKIFFVLAMGFLTVSTGIEVNAKPKKSLLGYWVVQDHVKGNKEAVVRFYSTNDSLVYEQNLGERKIDLTKKNIKKLDRAFLKYHRRKGNKEKFMITKL